MDVFVPPAGAGDLADGDWNRDVFNLSVCNIPSSGDETHGECALFPACNDVMNVITFARALRRRGWPRVGEFRPRKTRFDLEIEELRMEQCMQVALQNADFASAILRLDDTNAVATSFKEKCSIAKLQAVPPINTNSKASRSMEPYKHLFWEWISVIETGVMPPLIPHLPKEFVQDIKIVLRKKNKLRWCSVEDVILQAKQLRFRWRCRNAYKREFSEAGQTNILHFNALLSAELLALNPVAL